jgi:hypothetical protein
MLIAALGLPFCEKRSTPMFTKAIARLYDQSRLEPSAATASRRNQSEKGTRQSKEFQGKQLQITQAVRRLSVSCLLRSLRTRM